MVSRPRNHNQGQTKQTIRNLKPYKTKKASSFEEAFVHYSDKISNLLIADLDKFHDFFEQKNG
jgi:hypothetical protein